MAGRGNCPPGGEDRFEAQGSACVASLGQRGRRGCLPELESDWVSARLLAGSGGEARREGWREGSFGEHDVPHFGAQQASGSLLGREKAEVSPAQGTARLRRPRRRDRAPGASDALDPGPAGRRYLCNYGRRL